MWEHRNAVNNNTLHPRRAAEVEEIRMQLQFLYQQGHEFYQPQDRLLFAKTEATLLSGTPVEMLQWIVSVGHAAARSQAATAAQDLSMQPERASMRRWLNRV